MTNDEEELLQERVAKALGIHPHFPPMILIRGDGAVRHVLTVFGDPIEEWWKTLDAAGIPTAPDANVRGGIEEVTPPPAAV